MAGVGHEDQFRPSSLSGGSRLGQATFAGTGGKEEDAPIPDARCDETEPLFTTGRAAPLLLRLHSYLGQILLCGLRLASIENFQHRQKCLDSAHGKRFDPQLDVIDAFLRVGS